MALFNRKQKNSSVLPEVDQYYQGERRDRTWLAWILAAISIVIVVLILVGLFFAGRWAYNAITDDDTEKVATNNDVDDTDLPSIDGGTEDSQDTDSDGTEGAGDDNASDAAENGSQDEAESDSEGTVDAPAQTTIPSGQSSETPRTGASSEDLPNTGPAGLASAFVVTSGLAGGVHYVVNRKRQK